MENIFFKNVYYVNPLGKLNIDYFNEYDYLNNIFQSLSNCLPDFYSYNFIIYHCTVKKVFDQLIDYQLENKILIWCSEETGCIPPISFLSNFLLVFKTYLSDNIPRHIDNLYPFPLGYSKKIKYKEPCNFYSRSINVFFSGCLNVNRVNFYLSVADICNFQRVMINCLLRIPLLKRWIMRKIVSKATHSAFDNVLCESSVIRFTSGFEKGFDPAEFTDILVNSKIVISPKGFHSSECYRMYEALREGCIVITETLPCNNLFDNTPFIVIGDWKNLKSILNHLLQDEGLMMSISQKSIQYYFEKFSPESVANYVQQVLSRYER
jgi:hypothetical protein